MTTKYFIDIFRNDDYESRTEWQSLTFNEVILVLENIDFEEDAIYCLSEQGGEEDVARWTYDDLSVIDSYITYIKQKNRFDLEND